MPLNPTYSAGTVSVTAGGTTVTGNLTLWLAAGIREGDVFECRGLTATIASVNSSTSITLVRPWFGSTVTGSEYEIRYIADASRVIGAARTVVERFEASQPLFDGAYASYQNMLDVVPTLAPTVRAIKAVVNGTETRWIRDVSGAALGGGWAPADMATPQNYGGSGASALAAAVADNPNTTIRINYDEQALPANFAGALLEYTSRAAVRSYGLTTFEPANVAQRMLRTMHPTRGAGNEIGQMIEAVAIGSGLNGPGNATIAQAIAVAKRSYGSGSAVGGEIDGLRITVRQDGPQGLANNDPGSSDSAGLLINVQNRGDCGWIAAFEAQTTNAAVGGGVARQIQTKIGVLNTNDTLKRSYGFSAVGNTGSNHSAFYALNFDFALFSDAGLAIRPSGEYAIITPEWATGGGRLIRGQGINDAFTVQGRGANGITITAPEGFVSFATGGIVRMRVASDGHWVPQVNNGANLGAASLRWNNAFLSNLNVSGSIISMSGLPTSNPADGTSRLWMDPATRTLRVGT